MSDRAMTEEALCAETEISETAFRHALSRFTTGITVVTTRDHHGQPRAITVNAFTSVSLDPPLILYCLGKTAFHFGVFDNAEAFAVNVLGADQQALSDRFARECEDDLAGLRLEDLLTGSPVLPDHLTALDCTTHARHDAGDHVIIVGRVRMISDGPTSDPLLYFQSRYRALKPFVGD